MSTAVLEMPGQTPNRQVTPTHLDRVVLTGFMGSGKTTVGAMLADRLGWEFRDLDREIEFRDGRTVPQIFAESGEQHFRRLESLLLATLLGQKKVVLALGGGAPEDLGNQLLLEQTPRTAVFYLAAPLEVMVARCQQQALNPAATSRPLLAYHAAAAQRFAVRRPLYERIADHTVDTSVSAPDKMVTTLLDLLLP
jgi:shikimate kinase